VILLLCLTCPCPAQPAEKAAFTVRPDRNYYTTEERGRLVVSVSEALAKTNLNAEVLKSGRRLGGPVAMKPGIVNLVEIPLKDFPVGENRVLCLLRADGEVTAREEATIVKLPPKDNEVKIDNVSGGLIVDGLPFFPFGFYCYSPVQPTLADEEIVKGFNVMSPYQSNNPKTIAERRAYMDRCAELGMKAHFQLLDVAGGGGVMASDPRKARDKREQLGKEIRAFRDHPALLAWYISDEPTGHGAKPEELKAVYDAVKELDPYHPITIVFNDPGAARDYAEAMDLVMADPYPIPHGSPAGVGEVAAGLAKEFGREKPVWIVPQAFGGNEIWTREPTAAEERLMTYLAAIHGATGIQYFIRHGMNGFPKSQIAWAECASVALEIAELTPALLSHESPPKMEVSPETVQAQAWLDRGLVTILAANTSKEPTSFRLSLKDVDVTGKAHAVFEDRFVDVADGVGSADGVGGADGVIEDMIDAYGTRAYQIAVGPMPADSIEVRPGNLTLDPSFESNPSPGTPSACYANVGQGAGSGRGATYFIDSRVARHGRHSLRMHLPTGREAVGISPYAPTIREGQGYTWSVWARARPPLSLPETRGFLSRFFPGKRARRPGPVTLEVRATGFQGEPNDTTTENETSVLVKRFPLTEQWQQCLVPGTATVGGRGWASFSVVTPGTAWLDLLEMHADPMVRIEKGAAGGAMKVHITTGIPDGEIRFTTDGTEPSLGSGRYEGPFSPTGTGEVRATIFKDGGRRSSSRISLFLHDANNCRVELARPYAERYDGGGKDGLTNGVRGTQDFKDGAWQGFEDADLIATIDLEREIIVRDVRAGFYQNIGPWIFMPTRVDFLVSHDGETFRAVAAVENTVPNDQGGAIVKDFAAKVDADGVGEADGVGGPVPARYVRVHAHSVRVCPQGHPYAGQKAWVFCDEILVNADGVDSARR
jgi:hypothetical protein